MHSYVPFLKLKSSEIMALKCLEEDVFEGLIPFFDYAKRKGTTEESFIQMTKRLVNSIRSNIGTASPFYLDNYDITSNFIVGGEDSYAYLLSSFSEFPLIPVVSIDRSAAHVKAVVASKSLGEISSDVLAIRFTEEDFNLFEVIEDELDDILSDVIELFSQVDLIMDCRVCIDADVNAVSNNVVDFIHKFCDAYKVRRVVISGSMIPASIGGIAGVESEVELDRVELQIFDNVARNYNRDNELVLGDYTSVSPDYSDVNMPPELLRRVTTPKVIYAFENMQLVLRGSALQTHPLGNGQYQVMIQNLMRKQYFRGETFSFGDSYLGERSRGQGGQVTPGAIVKPLVNAHISYMVKNYI